MASEPEDNVEHQEEVHLDLEEDPAIRIDPLSENTNPPPSRSNYDYTCKVSVFFINYFI